MDEEDVERDRPGGWDLPFEPWPDQPVVFRVLRTVMEVMMWLELMKLPDGSRVESRMPTTEELTSGPTGRYPCTLPMGPSMSSPP